MTSPLLHRCIRTARAVRAVVAQPPYVAPGHFYSPLTSAGDVDRALRPADAVGVDLSQQRQLSLAAALRPVLEQPLPGPRYVADNSMYGPGDAAVYRGMLRQIRPRNIVEVGSGFSTAVALDEAESGELSGLKITCIEPYPDRLLGLLSAGDRDRVTLVRSPVQDTDLELYRGLGPDDVLFIDSTHVVKAGSDVSWLILQVLPRLAPGVIVHVHDIFWPFEYPAAWLREHRDWTENYLVHAFLIGNADWEIMLFSSWLWQEHPEMVPDRLAAEHPGSLWLRRRAGSR
ncbi:MAG TPA: class I SAM-dependent methyltransferase [Streptosporangiaceae bacterium]|nr:class I SAM-dependent methyltransferase [Streptosporangiaceae bacterium]